MKTKELIKKLERLIKNHEPNVKTMGEHEIMIDSFCVAGGGTAYKYLGLDPEIRIELSSDGNYTILSALK